MAPIKINVSVNPEHTHLKIEKIEASFAFTEENTPSAKY